MVNREVNYIISPTLGVLPEEVYDTIEDFARDVISIDAYVHDMRYKHGILIKGAATILAEYFDATKSGEDIYNDLQEIGFKETNALAAVKTLSVLDDAHRQLIDELCYNPDYAIHMMSLADKLKVADFDYNTYQKWYAISKEHIVYPIKTVYVDEIFEPTQFADVCPIPEDIPTEEDVLRGISEQIYEAWRPFKISMRIDYTPETGTRREIEFEGLFVARKENIIDWTEYYSRGRVVSFDILGEAFDVGTEMIKEFAEIKGYVFDEPRFQGVDLKEDISDTLVLDMEASEHTSTQYLTSSDKQFAKTEFEAEVSLNGYWWEDEAYCISEMRRVIDVSMRREL